MPRSVELIYILTVQIIDQPPEVVTCQVLLVKNVGELNVFLVFMGVIFTMWKLYTKLRREVIRWYWRLSRITFRMRLFSNDVQFSKYFPSPSWVRFQLVPEVYVIGWLKDAKAGT